MIDQHSAPYATTLLRVSLGALFLAHAGLKILAFTPAGTAGFFQSLGLPGPRACLVILAELLSGLALIAGVYARYVAPALVPILLGAIFTVHGPAGFFFDNEGGGWEFLALWIAGLGTAALLGDGAWALRPATRPSSPPDRH